MYDQIVEDSGFDVLRQDNDDQSPVTMDKVIEAGVLLFLCVTSVGSNVLVIATLLTIPSPKDAIDYYSLSLAVADLLCGVAVVPLSLYPAIAQDWVYGDFLCKLSGYFGLTLWSVNVYTFMWIAVDRYLAIRKPLRYDTIQTRTRCQCWMLFTWLTSMFLCCPPLLGFSKGIYYKDAYVCMLDLGNMLPYSVTVGCLVLAPSLLTINYAYFYIFTTMHKLRQCMTKEEREYATAMSENLSNPDHVMAFVLILMFWLSWLPWISLRTYEQVTGAPIVNHLLHFSFFWVGVLDILWKPITYVALSPKFRLGLKIFCMSLCCRWKSRQQLII